MLFGRKLQLAIGSKSQQIEKIYDEQMNINFTVKRTIDGKTPDTATITIYNANESLYEQYISNNDMYARIECGYMSEFGTLFVGDVLDVDYGFQGADKTLVLECGDGAKAIELTEINKGYAPNISVGQIVGDVVDSMADLWQTVKSSVTKESIAELKSKKLSFGSLLKGKSSNILDKYLKGEGYNWNIANDTINIFKENFNEQQYKISPETGLIGSPKKGSVQQTGTNKGNINIPSVDFTCFIIPAIVCGNTIEIESRYINGTYTIQEMIINGQTRGTQWQMQITAI